MNAVFRRALLASPGGYFLLAAWRNHRFRHRYDAMLLSYPKSGRTWLRMMLGRIFQDHFGLARDAAPPLELLALARQKPGIPRIQVAHDDMPHLRRAEELQTGRKEYRGCRVVFMVRDPRDVMVSNFFQASRRDRYFNGTLSQFLRSSQYGCAGLLRYMAICDANRHVPAAFLCIRYEDLQADPAARLREVLSFVGLPDVPDALVSRIVSECSFGNMRRLEEEGSLGSGRLRAGDSADPESFKVRRGKVGGFRDYLAPADVQYIEELMRRELPPSYGYDPHRK